MSSRRKLITSAVAAAVAVPGLTVFRSRAAALARGEVPAVLVEPKEESVETRSSGQAIRDFRLSIAVFIRSDTPDDDLDPFLVAIHAALCADMTLGGLCARIIEESTEWTMDEADLTAMEASLVYRIRYSTPWNALDTAP